MSPKSVDQDSVDLSSLPSLPGSWVWCIPADVCSVIASGSTPKPNEMYAEAGDVPFIKVYNLTHRGVLDFSVKPTFIDRSIHLGLLARSRVLPDDVLINIVGPPLGKVAIVPSDYPEWNVNQAVVVFRPEAGVLNKYLAFAFLTDSIMRRVTSLAKATAGQFNIGVGMCRRLLPLPMAPTNEQHRIVAQIDELFSDLDAGVAALKRAKANLKRYRAAVLKAAVEGKLTEEWRSKHPAKEPASKLLERILKERHQKWETDQLAKFAASGKEPPKNWREKYVEPSPPVTTELPELPHDWCWASVDQICDVGTGTTPSRANAGFYECGSIPWIMSGAVNHPFVDEASEFVTELALQETTLRLYPKGTLILALYGEGKTRGMVSELRIEATVNQALGTLVFSDSAISIRPFVKVFLTSNYVQLRRQAAGGMQPNLNLGIVKQIAIPLPPISEQAPVVAEVASRVSQIDAAETSIEHDLLRAARLRQSILKQAFQGKLVPQDPTDEPASVLLERLRASRSVHEGNGKAKAPTRTRGCRVKSKQASLPGEGGEP